MKGTGSCCEGHLQFGLFLPAPSGFLWVPVGSGTLWACGPVGLWACARGIESSEHYALNVWVK
ncbi:hypothetical protein EYF80_057938 [Liparis tanakae]|uniref:Uncharacterized protein n=1 Tax=Liparis tanakae TaxID=230148 RepID=A0A4Z2EU42_9TELE|nr:hypothetical protein EYF80_057938 [Liparis tanakae]